MISYVNSVFIQTRDIVYEGDLMPMAGRSYFQKSLVTQDLAGS